MIRLFDSVDGEVRDLKLRDAGRVSMYVCGPTVDNLPHLGHGRFTLVWDVARRWFTFRGLDVTYVSNITDIEDKIIARSIQEDRTTSEVVATYEALWWEAMDLLGVARPDEAPHATDYVAQMIELISSFLENDLAYVISDGVYLDVSRVPDYGLLAGQPLDSLRAGARVEAVEEKRSPLDFALWKNAKPGEPSWAAPFGEGRPGWHTECVVMSLGLLGDDFDLHCGGLDLKFPHHENERAQAVAAGRVFSRHWSHNGLVMVEGEKMSKSLGNFTSLINLAETSDPRAYRLLVLRSHYRSPLEVTNDTIADAERALARLDALARRFELPVLAGETLEVASNHRFVGDGIALYEEVSAVLDDDLKTPLAVAMLFDALAAANTAADAGDEERGRGLADAVNVLFGALGLALHSKEDAVDPHSADLVTRRDEARAAKDWAEADRLRNELVTLGWVVEDSSAGTLIRRP
ncbi:MAG TPA: cysteine--tRNA ligase [Acidimicrobiales bacterium]|nr:cysteine--tRNA ligase [Acidimicrobiales bacterium]